MEVTREGERAKQAYQAAYSADDMRIKGEEILKQKVLSLKEKKKHHKKDHKKDKNGHEEEHHPENGTEIDKSDDNIDFGDMSEEDRVLGFEWDGKGKHMDATKLTATYRELEFVHNQALLMRERLADEIVAIQDILLSIVGTRVVK